MELSKTDREHLVSLGYISPDTEKGGLLQAALEKTETDGGSPADHTEDIALYAHAHKLISDRQYAKAEEPLRKVVEAFPQASVPLDELALALRRQNRSSEIADVCMEVLNKKPEATEMRVYLAKQLLMSGKLSEGINQLNTVIRMVPSHGEAHYELGNAYRAQKDFTKSRIHYEQALEIAPSDQRVLTGLGKLCYLEGNLEEALTYLREAHEINPRSGSIKRELDRVMAELDSESDREPDSPE